VSLVQVENEPGAWGSIFEMISLPAVVTMDARWNSLHKEGLDKSQAELAKYVK
jgi:hypothetical protein